MNTLLFALWFFLPAGIANMVPVFTAKLLPNWTMPLDFGLLFRGKRIFGSHKTIRGVVIGVLFGIFVSCLQFVLFQNQSWIKSFVPFDYMKGNPFVFGLLLSLGALLGDAVKSFFKRRVGVASGKMWFPFDQLDYIFGGILSSLIWIRLDGRIYILIFIMYFLLHILSTTMGYLLHLKKSIL